LKHIETIERYECIERILFSYLNINISNLYKLLLLLGTVEKGFLFKPPLLISCSCSIAPNTRTDGKKLFRQLLRFFCMVFNGPLLLLASIALNKDNVFVD